MTLEAGQELLHYRLIETVGQGGMGIVWKALDTTLDREVAIKVLPADFAQDPERLSRFAREARLLATLDHPNVATVYGLHDCPAGGSAPPVRFLAMEWVPGEDLAHRLRRGRLKLAEALDVGRQIAEALEAAHGRGVIHRDLKPANVRIAPGGKVKVLDFGLAKAIVASAEPAADPTAAPTITRDGTVAGTLVGTAGYMSPEQVRCQEVDARTDVWAFGCVVWECLTGRRAFAGGTASDALGAILHTEPDAARLPADTPPNVRRVLQRCLAKDPARRYHHIADARIDLAETETAEAPRPRASRIWPVALAVLGIALAASLVWRLPWSDRAPAGGAPATPHNPLAGARFSKITERPSTELESTISPDGRFVAFASNRDGPFEIYVGQIGGTEFRNLSRGVSGITLEEARAPVRSIGFDADGSELVLGGGTGTRLKRAPLLGGPLRNFLDEDAIEVAWSPDGQRIVYHSKGAGDPTFVANADGTNRRLLLDSVEGMHQHNPTWSLDGEWIYLVRGRETSLGLDLWRVRADGRDAEQLTRDQLNVNSPTPMDEDTVLYCARAADGAGPWLWAVDVDTKESRRATVGMEQYLTLSASADRSRLVATIQDPQEALWSVPILDRVAVEDDAEPFAIPQRRNAHGPRFGGGALFFLSSRGSGDGLWRLRDGTVTEIWSGSEGTLLWPAAVSPDGESVAIVLRKDTGWHVHRLSADGAELERLSDSVDARGAAAWSPDGRWIAVGGRQGGRRGLFKVPVDGGPAERLAEGDALNPAWSPDGGMIAYVGRQVRALTPLLAVRPDGTRVELPAIQLWVGGHRLRFLPDGSALIYIGGSGASETETSILPGEQHFWRLDLNTMERRRLTDLDQGAVMLSFDVTPDGRRIVFDRVRENSDVVLIELAKQR